MTYWEALSGQWIIVPPLCPSPADIAGYEGHAAAAQRGDSLDALLLGLTPSIATMRWPAGTRLIATDWAANMIRSLWGHADTPPGASAVRGDWRELPFSDASFDSIIGDGCYTAVGALSEIAALNREVRRVLRTGGMFCQRCFCRPAQSLHADELFEGLFTGRLRNLDLFRWLLAMSVQGDNDEGVRLRAVWEVWHRRVPNALACGAQLGWSREALVNIERWRELDTCYLFPDRAQLGALLGSGMTAPSFATPAYDYGELFPTMVSRAK